MPPLRKIALAVGIVFLCAAVAACSSPPPTLTAAPLPTTVKPTSVPSTTTPVPTITITPRPSNTATIVLPTRTRAPNYERTQLAQTETVYETQIAPFPVNCKDYDQYNSLLSPGGNWLAVSCGYKRDQTLEVVRKDGKRWTLKFNDYLVEDNHDSGAPGNLYPVQWFHEDYLYFISSIAYSGGGACFYGIGGEGIFRIQLSTGAVTAVVPPREGPSGYLFAFSPDGRWLVYTGNPTILDLQTGETIQMDAGQWSVGDFTWSPDGKKLAYAICSAKRLIDNILVDQSGVRIFSMDTRTSKTIYIVSANDVAIESKSGEPLLEFSDYAWPANVRKYFSYDWSSEQLMTATPTQAP